MNVIVDGLMTSYQKIGEGKTLLMLHGWGDSKNSFKPLADRLKNSYKIVVLDLPGFGDSQTPPEAWGVRDFADFVKDFLTKIDLQPYAVAGHSFGGSVALELASRQPDFKRLILLAAAGIRGKRPVRSGLIKVTSKTGKGILYALPHSQRDKFKRRLYGSIGSDALLMPHMEVSYRRIIAEDMKASAAKTKLPTLLIFGSRDKSTPPSDGMIFHNLLQGSDLEIIDAGHFLHQEEPDKVAELMNNFLTAA